MTDLPVINRGRMERLKLPEEEGLSMNTVCIVLICLVILGLYKRYVDISQSRERFYTLGTSPT
jgi:hypothetical protein